MFVTIFTLSALETFFAHRRPEHRW